MVHRVLVIVWIAGLALAPAGCLYLPRHETSVQGDDIRPEDLAFIVTNETVRGAIEERLGPPPYYWQDHRLMIYEWVMRQGMFVIVLPDAVGVIDEEQRHLLLVQLDEDDCVRRHEVVEVGGLESTRGRVEAWLEAPAGAGSS